MTDNDDMLRQIKEALENTEPPKPIYSDIWLALNNNPSIGCFLFLELQKRWPQLNEQTRIVRVYEGHSVQIAIQAQRQWKEDSQQVKKYGYKALFWRIAGQIFQRENWHNKGMQWKIKPVAPYPNSETLNLEALGWSIGLSSGRIYCAYHPTTDTLYLRQIS